MVIVELWLVSVIGFALGFVAYSGVVTFIDFGWGCVYFECPGCMCWVV